MSNLPLTYVAVDTDAIGHNVRQVLGRLKQGCQLCAVVKADAYGHGLELAARTCVESGANWLAVSTLSEGIALRQSSIDAPVLVFMPPLADEVQAAVEHDLTVTVTATDQVMELRRAGESQGRIARAHAYEDLGLGRIGPDENLLDIIEAAEPWPEIEISGVYSHLGPPGSDLKLDSIDWIQAGAPISFFAATLHEAIRQVTDRRLMIHVAASGLFLEHERNHLDMVRVGTLLYGQYPAHIRPQDRDLDLRETFELRSRIVSIHTVEKGAKIGYGGEFRCRRETRIGTVPVGTAHGLGMMPESALGRWRGVAKGLIRASDARRGRPASLPMARIGDKLAPIIGRVSMDQCAVDITDLPGVARGSEVVLPARRLAVIPTIPRIPMDLTQN